MNHMSIQTARGDISSFVSRHATFLTWATVIGVVVVGTTIIDNPGQWWVAVLAVVLVFGSLFAIVNARALVKMLVSVVLMLIQAMWAFRIGSIAHPEDSTAALWLLATAVSFFGALTFSYWKPSRNSRWTWTTLSLLVAFAVTFGMLTYALPGSLSVVVGVLAGWLMFGATYPGWLSRRKARNMPPLQASDELLRNIGEAARPHGWGVVRGRKSKHGSSVLVWDDEKAFLLTTMAFKQKFGVGGGKRKQFLTYRGDDITSWLWNSLSELSPRQRMRGASPLLVILDSTNGNGRDPRVMGVSLPDSKAQLPVAVMSAREFLDRGNYLQLLRRVKEEFGGYTADLDSRSIYALDSLLPAVSPADDSEAHENADQADEATHR